MPKIKPLNNKDWLLGNLREEEMLGIASYILELKIFEIYIYQNKFYFWPELTKALRSMMLCYQQYSADSLQDSLNDFAQFIKNNLDILYFGNQNVDLEFQRISIFDNNDNKYVQEIKRRVELMQEKTPGQYKLNIDSLNTIRISMCRTDRIKSVNNPTQKLTLGQLGQTLLFMMHNSNLAQDKLCLEFERWLGRKVNNQLELGHAINFENIRAVPGRSRGELAFIDYVQEAYMVKNRLFYENQKFYILQNPFRNVEKKIEHAPRELEEHFHARINEYFKKRWNCCSDEKENGIFFETAKSRMAKVDKQSSLIKTYYRANIQTERRAKIKTEREEIAKKYLEDLTDCEKKFPGKNKNKAKEKKEKEKPQYELDDEIKLALSEKHKLQRKNAIKNFSDSNKQRIKDFGRKMSIMRRGSQYVPTEQNPDSEQLNMKGETTKNVSPTPQKETIGNNALSIEVESKTTENPTLKSQETKDYKKPNNITLKQLNTKNLQRRKSSIFDIFASRTVGKTTPTSTSSSISQEQKTRKASKLYLASLVEEEKQEQSKDNNCQAQPVITLANLVDAETTQRKKYKQKEENLLVEIVAEEYKEAEVILPRAKQAKTNFVNEFFSFLKHNSFLVLYQISAKTTSAKDQEIVSVSDDHQDPADAQEENIATYYQQQIKTPFYSSEDVLSQLRKQHLTKQNIANIATGQKCEDLLSFKQSLRKQEPEQKLSQAKYEIII